MKKRPSRLTLAVVSLAAVVGAGALLSMRTFAQQATGIADSALEQMAAISSLKQGLTPVQQKIDSSLVFAAKAANGAPCTAT